VCPIFRLGVGIGYNSGLHEGTDSQSSRLFPSAFRRWAPYA